MSEVTNPGNKYSALNLYALASANNKNFFPCCLPSFCIIVVYIKALKKDKDILQAIREGKDSEALSYLYKATLKKVRNYIIKNSGNKEEADDIFQEAIMIFFLKVKQGEFEENHSIDGFIYTIARNMWINKAKRHARHRAYEAQVLKENPFDDEDQLTSMLDREKSAAMESLFNRLEENCRKILKYAIYDRLSMREISVKMGHKNEKVSKAQHYRCKQYLARMVKENKHILEILQP